VLREHFKFCLISFIDTCTFVRPYILQMHGTPINNYTAVCEDTDFFVCLTHKVMMVLNIFISQMLKKVF
jgi:hypothetical protein